MRLRYTDCASIWVEAGTPPPDLSFHHFPPHCLWVLRSPNLANEAVPYCFPAIACFEDRYSGNFSAVTSGPRASRVRSKALKYALNAR